MRETLKEWKNEWIDTNGETNELEVVINDSSLTVLSEIYAGSFKFIPNSLLDKKVTKVAQIVTSSIKDRIGAYSLTI